MNCGFGVIPTTTFMCLKKFSKVQSVQAGPSFHSG
jgi:hypothetical protein